MAVPAAALSGTLGHKGPPWKGAEGTAHSGGRWGWLCSPRAQGGPAPWRAPQPPLGCCSACVHPPAASLPMSCGHRDLPQVRPGSGLGLNVTRKCSWFPPGRYSSLRTAFLCLMFSGIPDGFPSRLPHSRERLDQMHHWAFTLMSFVL